MRKKCRCKPIRPNFALEHLKGFVQKSYNPTDSAGTSDAEQTRTQAQAPILGHPRSLSPESPK